MIFFASILGADCAHVKLIDLGIFDCRSLIPFMISVSSWMKNIRDS